MLTLLTQGICTYRSKVTSNAKFVYWHTNTQEDKQPAEQAQYNTVVIVLDRCTQSKDCPNNQLTHKLLATQSYWSWSFYKSECYWCFMAKTYIKIALENIKYTGNNFNHIKQLRHVPKACRTQSIWKFDLNYFFLVIETLLSTNDNNL